MAGGRKSKAGKGTAVSKDKLIQCEGCEMWQELGRGDLVHASQKTVSKEGYKYVCSKCKEVEELKSKLEGNKNQSKCVGTNQDKEKEGRKIRTVKDKGRPDTLIIGDSIVRGLSPFREAKGEKGKTISIGGAGIARVADEVKAECQAGKVKRMVLEVGTNDVGRGEGTEIMLRQYRHLLEGAKRAAREVAVVSVLPRFDKSWTVNAKILSINLRLEKMCKELNVSFIDGFSVLVDRPGFYRDKLHLNTRGKLALERLCMEFFDEKPLN